MVFFFRVGPVVLQMEIDRLGNFHGAPPVVWLTGDLPTLGVYTMMQIGWRGGATGSGNMLILEIRSNVSIASMNLYYSPSV